MSAPATLFYTKHKSEMICCIVTYFIMQHGFSAYPLLEKIYLSVPNRYYIMARDKGTRKPCVTLSVNSSRKEMPIIPANARIHNGGSCGTSYGYTDWSAKFRLNPIPDWYARGQYLSDY